MYYYILLVFIYFYLSLLATIYLYLFSFTTNIFTLDYNIFATVIYQNLLLSVMVICITVTSSD